MSAVDMLILPRVSSWPINRGRGSPLHDRLVLAVVPISMLDDLHTRARESNPLALVGDPFNRARYLGSIHYELPFLAQRATERTRRSSLNAEPPSNTSTNPFVGPAQTTAEGEQAAGHLNDDASIILLNTGHAFQGQPRFAGHRFSLPGGMRTPSSHSSLSLSSGSLSGLFSRARSVTPSILHSATHARAVHMQTINELFPDSGGSSPRRPSDDLESQGSPNPERMDNLDQMIQNMQPPSPRSESVRAEAPVSDQDEAQRNTSTRNKRRKRSNLVPEHEEEDVDDDNVCPACKKRKSEHNQRNNSEEPEEGSGGAPDPGRAVV